MINVLLIAVGKRDGGVENYIRNVLSCKMEKVAFYVVVRKGKGLDKYLLNNWDRERIFEIELGKMIFVEIKKLKKFIYDNRIDIIQTNGINAMVIEVLLGKTNCKHIAYIHGDVEIDHQNKKWILKNIYRWVEKRSVIKADRCVAVSNNLKSILISRGIAEKKITVIYNGIESMSYSKLPNYNAECLKIACIANFYKEKGHAVLIEAMNILKNEYPNVNISCDLYGDGNEREIIEQLIIKHNLNNIVLHGFKENAREHLNQYALYIQPSFYESFCIALVEAMHGGCCCIASNVGGMIELIEDKKNGFMFSVGNSQELADIIHMCYINRDYIREIGEKAKKTSDRFLTTQMGDDLFCLYKELINV